MPKNFETKKFFKNEKKSNILKKKFSCKNLNLVFANKKKF